MKYRQFENVSGLPTFSANNIYHLRHKCVGVVALTTSINFLHSRSTCLQKARSLPVSEFIIINHEIQASPFFRFGEECCDFISSHSLPVIS